ncbi:tRNA (adenosine(37)-N6)-threonylcarbamoyltransferase complex transferase subunit TsaD [Candidatus Woesearchaeota archaeon]|nr:tRNA (adenosine(37)-N6)-threonylcarbamoyltransferase complex transferase subunit TsaD [Candidatus Woesearchaeota archaeon]
MKCLGIESTAHTFGVGVVDFNGSILSNEKAVFTTASGGMVPHEVAKHHREVCDTVFKKALEKANVKISDISLISYSHGPGLSPALIVGKDFAKRLSQDNNIDIIGVNHCVAHLTIGTLVTDAVDPVYLYVSGVNTQVIALASGKFRIFGETLDIGLGNALDKFGREAGLGFPAGPVIEKMAIKGKYIELPYTVKGMDVSFAGLVTKTKQLLDAGVSKEDLCYSMQEVCFAMLAEISERAMAHCEKDELLLIGGVGANKRLISMLKKMCSSRNAKFYSVPLEYAGDQAAMIAWQGILEFRAGKRIKEIDIYPYERVDDVEVIW